MKKYIFSLALLSLLFASCNDWLDVKGENTVKETDQLDNYNGLRDALTGCYMAMADVSAYGQKLTMTDIETMADLWTMDFNSRFEDSERYSLHHHLWENDGALTPIATIYGSLFNIIAQANMVIKHGEQQLNGSVGEKIKILVGEAYAIRAYCQLDVLRLFGQLPQGGTRTVELPYSFTTNVSETPQYYSFDDYVSLLDRDVAKALQYLEGRDPVLSHSFEALNAASSNLLDDNFFYYRQTRLNYWAVKALQARMDLYVGRKQQAHAIATEIIQATNPNGEAVMGLSGSSDLPKRYYALPSECLFCLSKYDVKTTSAYLVGGATGVQITSSHYAVSAQQLAELYASISSTLASHNRYNNLWNMQSKSAASVSYPTLKKYWYSDEETENLQVKHQIIPMLRLSEIYLIAVETASTLEEANQTYATYMRSCEVLNPTKFASAEQLKLELMNEYRRELFGEGQMFYTYKRLNAKTMMWNSDTMTEDDYIVPLPQTEHNPSKNN